MPATITALCCAQAWLLERLPDKSLLVTVQAAAPLFDGQIPASQVHRAVVVLQGSLFALSLLLGALAQRSDPYYGGAAMNALIKSLAPLMCIAIKGDTRSRNWLAALGSFGGIVLATGTHAWLVLTPDALTAYSLLFAATLAGVALGLVQEYYGHCWREMSLVSALICAGAALYDKHEPTPQLALELALYGTLSFFVNRAMRQYTTSVHQSAFWLGMALNERRAVTIALGAWTSAAPTRLLLGAALTLASVQTLTYTNSAPR